MVREVDGAPPGWKLSVVEIQREVDTGNGESTEMRTERYWAWTFDAARAATAKLTEALEIQQANYASGTRTSIESQGRRYVNDLANWDGQPDRNYLDTPLGPVTSRTLDIYLPNAPITVHQALQMQRVVTYGSEQGIEVCFHQIRWQRIAPWGSR